jgi:Flp pilus assembly protein TadD
MSLLLDALKRAEEAKRAKLSAEQGGISPIEAKEQSPIPPSAASAYTGAAGAVSAELAELRLADYDDSTYLQKKPQSRQSEVESKPVARGGGSEFGLEPLEKPVPSAQEPAISRGTQPPRIGSGADRETVRNVFVAKQPVRQETASGKKWLLPAIALAVVVVGAGGWYVWNEVSRISRPVAIAVRPPHLPVPQPAQPQQPPAMQSAATSAVVTPPAIVEPTLPPLLPPAEDRTSPPSPSDPNLSGSRKALPLDEREALAKALKETPQVPETPVTLRLARSLAPPTVSSELLEAYQSLKDANYPLAVTRYSRLVQTDPLSMDVQLGLATAFGRIGDSAAASRHFRAALTIDPRNAMAIAGLLAVSRTKGDSTEVELKTLLAKHPASAALHFSLGNQLASERRWVEAQQSYFEAYRLESDRPDYLYNLAVSLDHLGKYALAQEYYSKALAMPTETGAQFDKVAVARRLRELAGGQ